MCRPSFFFWPCIIFAAFLRQLCTCRIMMCLFAQELMIYKCVLKKCSISKSVWKCCVPVYIEMVRKITASHISFIAASIASKGFALYGCICTDTFKKYTFFGMGVRRHYFYPDMKESHSWGVILLFLYAVWCIVKNRRLGSVSKGFSNY